MANMTLSLPDDLHKEMRAFPDVRWSEVARRAIQEKLELLRLADALAKKSALSEADVASFSRLVKREAGKRFMEKQ